MLTQHHPNCSNQYKCGVFFNNLQGYPDPLAWIGGLPDVLAKKAVRDSPELLASFGNVERKDFVLRADQCGNVLANARCFAVVSVANEIFELFILAHFEYLLDFYGSSL